MRSTTERRSFPVPIERTRIAEFRRALNDTDGSPDLAPPTFVVVADQFDPAFDRRPRPGSPWPPTEALEALLHVEQRIDHARPLRAGEQFSAVRLPPRVWVKQGRRGGRLEFLETITELVDTAENVVVRSAWVDARTERSHAQLSSSATTEAEEPPDGALPIVLADPVTRTQLVMYVGVTGDFHPLHHDDAYANAHGYPGLFAPGMLTMALTALAVRSAIPEEATASFGGRFRGQVWPGDTLIGHVRVTSSGCTVSTRNRARRNGIRRLGDAEMTDSFAGEPCPR